MRLAPQDDGPANRSPPVRRYAARLSSCSSPCRWSAPVEASWPPKSAFWRRRGWRRQVASDDGREMPRYDVNS